MNASVLWFHWWSDSQWWLTIIAAVTAGVVCWQAVETRRAVGAGTKAADAALINAQAVINAERAKLLFEFAKGYTDGPGKGTTFTIDAVNYGRSPAELLWSRARETVINSFDDLIPLGDLPCEAPVARFLAPGQRYRVGEFIPISARLSANAFELATETKLPVNDQIRAIYGEVAYKDGISSATRLSRFCFRYVRKPEGTIRTRRPV